jgi:hypothetical protein
VECDAAGLVVMTKRYPRDSLYLSWLAEGYVQLGEVEHAANMATLMAILTEQTNSARADMRLCFLAGRLEPYKAKGKSVNCSTPTGQLRFLNRGGQGRCRDQ